MSNRIFAHGHVKTEPKVRTVGTPPKKVGEFRLDDGGAIHNVVCWEELADKIPALGAYVAVEGRLRYRSFDGKDGKVWVTEIVAGTLEVIAAPVAAPEEDIFA